MGSLSTTSATTPAGGETLLFLLLCITLALAAATTNNSSSYTPADHRILVNCGESDSLKDDDGHNWTSDGSSNFASSLKNTWMDMTTNTLPTNSPKVPYRTARFFKSSFTYTIPVTPGLMFVRLHFYPVNYTNHLDSLARFSVTAARFTLLKDFNTSQAARSLNSSRIVREYSVNVPSSSLNLTFAPSPNVSHSYAFINGIEIVPMPDIFGSAKPPILLATGQPYDFVNNIVALENMFRLNVGGSYISAVQDSGLFREWKDDGDNIFGAAIGVQYKKDHNVTIRYPNSFNQSIAPVHVYATARSMGPTASVNLKYNLTWYFTVDPGFFYLVRLHFCEIQYPITKDNQRVFDIFINNMTAAEAFDVIAWSEADNGGKGGIGVPVFRDFVVSFVDGSSQRDIWLALHPKPASQSQYDDAILNGVEIFKLSDPADAGLNPIIPSNQGNSPSPKDSIKRRKKFPLPLVIGGVVGGVVVFILLLTTFFVCCLRHTKESSKGPASDDAPWLSVSRQKNSCSMGSDKTHKPCSSDSSLPSSLCRRFSLAEVEMATDGFDDSLLLGVGGFGKVYRGSIDNGCTKVAIKRANPMSQQGIHEFQTEIELLSKLRHLHLVSLIGYCDENKEMILVYDFMAHGTLREHLYKTQKPPLPWKQRLDICIGAARGLHYLHAGAKHTTIHRDVKTTNILLDDKWVAKLSDCGLCKTMDNHDITHVSTAVKGSFGYLDPEYFLRQRLTKKSDVYSFGVVMFEVLCARPVIDLELSEEEVSLAKWALHCHRMGVLDQIIDPYLKGSIAPECLNKFAETAGKCLSENGNERPSMGDVVGNLELALLLQENEVTEEGDRDLWTDSKRRMCGANKGDSLSSTTDMEYNGLSSDSVFSEIINSEGR